MMKKGISSLLGLVMAVALVGCATPNFGDIANTVMDPNFDPSKTIEDASNAAAAIAEDITARANAFAEEISPEELQNLIETVEANAMESTWTGIDVTSKEYFLDLKDGQFTATMADQDGTEVMTGQFDVDGLDLVFTGASGAVKSVGNVDASFCFAGDEPYIKWNNVYLTRTDYDNAQKAFESLDLASKFANYAYNGHVWAAIAEDEVVLISLVNNSVQMKHVSLADGKAEVKDVDANWAMDYANMVLFDNYDKSIDDYTWNFTDEGDLKVFNLDSDTNEYIFYELETDRFDEAVDIAKSFLENEEDISEMVEEFEELAEEGGIAAVLEEYKDKLEGFKGVSVVEAFMKNGLDPKYKSRAALAKSLGIRNYTGTAEQNLKLIEMLGGQTK